ncbi:hypothetical protein ABZ816_08525 [Actinosynnema sp. NPDC047251]|uniref:Putative membrane protein n=1 Tax=Saccharothrix espanaensis (strain ATCC 51144 / DSM 44229 / JCM 9112 / NBRC 15066 / NRRL 15764) TaxID=1179773 RepID=K0K0T9_SACES|nr:hypothetical protein [Saccharothrix espanaensis]CCH33855.1 putative membrane protein [Saccharothrix espanaensis DSM 44229]
MKWYADRPGRLWRQLTADLFAAAWVWFWVSAALVARDTVLALRAPGDQMTRAGGGLHDTFTDAAAKAREVPLVGGKLGEALDKGRDAGATLVDAGRSQIEAVETTALWLTIALIAVPVAFLLVTWLPLRVRYARKAAATARLRDTRRFDLLALQALTTLPLRELARFEDDPADGWRRRDVAVVEALAARQLAVCGLRAAR